MSQTAVPSRISRSLIESFLPFIYEFFFNCDWRFKKF